MNGYPNREFTKIARKTPLTYLKTYGRGGKNTAKKYRRAALDHSAV